MNLKFGIDDRPRFGQLMLYSLQWFVLAIAVVTTSLFIAVGPPAERVLYAQKVFALMGITTILQVFWGHRLPIVVGPAAVLLVGIITALASQGAETDTGRSTPRSSWAAPSSHSWPQDACSNAYNAYSHPA